MCDDQTRIYYQHLKQGELWLQYCLNCQEHTFYPRSHCPGCLDQKLEWRKSQGQGRVYSYSIIHVQSLADDDVPYIYSLVTLDEGVRLATRIVDCSPEAVHVDMGVEMVVRAINGQLMPVFKPVAGLKSQA